MRSVGIIVLALCAGCSLEERGQALTEADSGVPDVVSVDGATTDVTVDVVEEPGPPLPCTSDASVCSGAVPNGWTLTMFSANRATPCPVNSTAEDVVASPGSTAGACTCSCNITTQPSCAIGQVTGKWANDNQCGNSWGQWTIATAGQCTAFPNPVTVGNYNQFSKLPLTAGACSGTPTPDTSKLTSTPMRTCAPSTACAEDVCNGQVPSGMRSCITAPGDVTCPLSPVIDKVAVVGPNATLECGTCTTCNVAGTCAGTATLKYWDDANCTVARGSITANGACNPTTNQHVSHFTYENPVQGLACNAGTSTPKVDLATKRTICCRP